MIFSALLGPAIVLAQTFPTTGPNDPIVAPPASLSYNGFYKKCVYFHGLPIMGSEKVRDKAFRVITDTFGKMLAKLPEEWIDHMVTAGSHYSIIGETEGQTDLPEYWDMKNDPKTDWNKRARGLGGLTTSGGEENILELPSDRYNGESIYIHEFGHTLASVVFSHYIKDFNPRLRETFQKARAEGLWDNTYSASNMHEYWAEGVQMYFDCARRAIPANGIHNEICNRVQLEKYDPGLYAMVDEAFNHNPWRYEGKYCTTHKSDGAIGKSTIFYRVTPSSDQKSVGIEMSFDVNDPDVELEMPSWSPGLYVKEDYWKTMGPVTAVDEHGKVLEVDHARNDTWMVASKGAKRLTVRYTRPVVESKERLGMFSSDADAIHLTGPSSFLFANGRKGAPCKLELNVPAGWKTAVSLSPSGTGFMAKSYDELVDSPVTMGKFKTEKYTVAGKTHTIALRGDARDSVDPSKVRDMCHFVTQAEGSFFGELPYDRYVWQFWATNRGDSAGGLEHAASTDMFVSSTPGNGALGGMAHEFFHLWNVKRIRSKTLGPFDYANVPKTGALWWLEGVTDYYASLLPYRYGKFDRSYLFSEALGNVKAVRGNAAREEVSPYDCSARVGESKAGSSSGYRVNYYPTGWVLGLLFDIELRNRTNGAHSLDDVELALWNECKDGKPGFEEGEIRNQLVKFGGSEMGPLYDTWVLKPGELPIEAQLAKVGLKLDGGSIVEVPDATADQKKLLDEWLAQKPIDPKFR